MEGPDAFSYESYAVTTMGMARAVSSLEGGENDSNGGGASELKIEGGRSKASDIGLNDGKTGFRSKRSVNGKIM